jgi:lipopolysaccharide/colanic/teichoic acid biosynthesis glycosyltransferase
VADCQGEYRMLSGVAEKRIVHQPSDNAQKACLKAGPVHQKKMPHTTLTKFVLLLTDAVLINIAFLLSFLIRYGLPFPHRNFLPYRKSFVFLTVIYISALSFFRVYKNRFKSSWELFKRISSALFLGTLLSIAFVYVFRVKWGAFPTSVFILSFFINLVLIFKLNQLVLKAKRRIKKKVIVIGEGEINDMPLKKAVVERLKINEIEELTKHMDTDEIIICDKIQDGNNLNLLIYLVQQLKIDVFFSPSVYIELLSNRINGDDSVRFLSTFIGKKLDVEEFFITALDILSSVLTLFLLSPLIALIVLLIKLTSPGPVFYKQQRTGKDGRVFTLYKFRTMIKDAEKLSGLAPVLENDPRITKVGKWLRRTRLDELPQLINILKGEMSLVGPRPENLYRVGSHKALQGLRLAVKPGLTGLAQIRSFYDLNPKHKIKYDYLYIQRKSFLLNLYILIKTIPVIFARKGW